MDSLQTKSNQVAEKREEKGDKTTEKAVVSKEIESVATTKSTPKVGNRMDKAAQVETGKVKADSVRQVLPKQRQDEAKKDDPRGKENMDRFVSIGKKKPSLLN